MAATMRLPAVRACILRKVSGRGSEAVAGHGKAMLAQRTSLFCSSTWAVVLDPSAKILAEESPNKIAAPARPGLARSHTCGGSPFAQLGCVWAVKSCMYTHVQ